MPSATHMPTIDDDERHAPGPGSLPLWNESYWFPLYDPQTEIGVVLRAGVYGNQGTANVYLFITHRGAIVHTWVEQRAPLPPLEPRRLVIGGLSIDIDAAARTLPPALRRRCQRLRLRWDGYARPTCTRGRPMCPSSSTPAT